MSIAREFVCFVGISRSGQSRRIPHSGLLETMAGRSRPADLSYEVRAACSGRRLSLALCIALRLTLGDVGPHRVRQLSADSIGCAGRDLP